MLFSSPVAGAGVGFDNISFLSWFQYGGKALKDLFENQSVILHDTPANYFAAYMNAAKGIHRNLCSVLG
jgi:hypothetical protein